MPIIKRISGKPDKAPTPRIPVKSIFLDPWEGAWGSSWGSSWGREGFGSGISQNAIRRVGEAPESNATKRVGETPAGGATSRVGLAIIAANHTKRVTGL